jgi:hypothetical protein
VLVRVSSVYVASVVFRTLKPMLCNGMAVRKKKKKVKKRKERQRRGGMRASLHTQQYHTDGKPHEHN